MQFARVLSVIVPLRLFAIVCLAAIGTTAGAQDFPSRQIVIVVPFPAGGGSDLFARVFAQKLAAGFGRAVIVDNRAGGSGNIGAATVAHAPPDGHTLLFTASTIALSQAIQKDRLFDAQRELAPVTMTALIPLILVVHPALPVHSVKDLLAIARARPGELAYGSAGVGSAVHFAMELLKVKTGANIFHVPYKGAAQIQTALLSGEVQLAFVVPPLAAPHIKSGKLRALGVSTLKRSAAFPTIPPLREAGVANFEAPQWHGFFLPAKTPPSVINRIHMEISKALASPEMKVRLAAEGADIVGSSPDEFARFFASEVAKWSVVAQRPDVKLE